MGLIGDRLFGPTDNKWRFIWQIIMFGVMIVIFTTIFKTSCVDVYQMGYDDCTTVFNKGVGLQENYYPNGTLANITIIPIDPTLTHKADDVEPLFIQNQP
ncbi:MAG: hypothetical protein DRN81_02105 [Thermoproteota archaeon]|nr:MAG: hypothetical protein DRN81_02105 [Candidatus Korarchaeota archaeon]